MALLAAAFGLDSAAYGCFLSRAAPDAGVAWSLERRRGPETTGMEGTDELQQRVIEFLRNPSLMLSGMYQTPAGSPSYTPDPEPQQ